jgi:nucleoside-diphosphate kinase
MALERTLTIIKPDAVAADFTGKIFAMIEEAGLSVIAVKMLHLSNDQACELYAEHKERSFYSPLLKFMTSGPVMVMVLEGVDAVQILRKTMGATVPKEAEVGTIRNLYAVHETVGGVLENAIHGSDSTESAQREMDFFFKANEICPRTR